MVRGISWARLLEGGGLFLKFDLIHVNYRTATAQRGTRPRLKSGVQKHRTSETATSSELAGRDAGSARNLVSLSGLARSQSTSTAWDRLVPTF